MSHSYLKASVNKFHCKDSQLCRLCTMVEKLLWTCSLLYLLLSGWMGRSYFWLLFPPTHTCRAAKIINSPAQLEGPPRWSAPTLLVGCWLSCINALAFGFLPAVFVMGLSHLLCSVLVHQSIKSSTCHQPPCLDCGPSFSLGQLYLHWFALLCMLLLVQIIH